MIDVGTDSQGDELICSTKDAEIKALKQEV